MNFIDQVYVALIYVGSELNKHIHIVIGMILAMTISFLKASKDHKPQNWGENLLCGIFAGIALTGIIVIQFFISTWFNLPEGIAVPTSLVVGVVSGVIAWHGTDGTIRLLKGIRGDKHDESTESSDSNGRS